MDTTNRIARGCTRRQFLRRGAQGVSVPVLGLAFPRIPQSSGLRPHTFDLREFVAWIVDEFEPSVRVAGGAGHYAAQPDQHVLQLYGVSDLACILYSIGALRPTAEERIEWAAAFQSLQDPSSGWLVEQRATHIPLHNTAFALAAMQLLDLTPAFPVRMRPEHDDISAFLRSLDWRQHVYRDSHRGAGVASIYVLARLGSPQWFADFFTTCDGLFDRRSGLMGLEKPAGGDTDQIGGTFHYSFLYEHFARQMPYPEPRIDAILRLQRPDGYWDIGNPLWLTLDAMYLMTRTMRYCPYRSEEVGAAIRRAMAALMRDAYSVDGRLHRFGGRLATHLVTAAISIAAEAQRFLGSDQVITEQPLRLVLDRRPFI